MKFWSSWGPLALVLAGAIALSGGPVNADEATQGKLPDGTPYRIDMPDHWNGVVLVGLDYASRDPHQAGSATEALLARGYAMAGTTRNVTGWSIHEAAANAVKTLDLFEAKYGKAKYAIEFGSSQGGHTAAVALQAYPTRWQGALPMCGGLSGSIGQWQAKFDALYVARALVAPASPAALIGLPADWDTTTRAQWRALLAEAQKTPEGRARLALAAVIAGVPDWESPGLGQPSTKPAPAKRDIAARQAGLIQNLSGDVLNQALSSRYQIEQRAGGNVTSNAGVDYAAVLKRVDREGLAEKIYARDGLDLKSDLALLAKAKRVKADAKGLAFMATGVFDGMIAAPVLTLNGIGDPISLVAGQQFYGEQVANAGKGAALRQVYTATAGHCGFNNAEQVAAVETLMTRLKTGAWPDTSATAMNARAASTGSGDGAPRFVSFTPPPFGRPYDACDLKRDLDRAGAQPLAVPGQNVPRCNRPR